MIYRVVNFFRDFYKTYKDDVSLLLYIIVMAKFSMRWIDSVFGLVFFPLMIFIFLKFDIQKKMYLLIFLLPFAESQQLPRQIFGIPGFNFVNFFFITVFITMLVRRRGRFAHSDFNGPITIFVLLIFFSAVRGVDAMRLLGDTSYLSYYMESFLKPMEIFFCGIIAFNLFNKPEQPYHYFRIIRISSILFGLWVLHRGGGTTESMMRLSMVTGLHKNSIGFMFAVLLAMNMSMEDFGTMAEKALARVANIVYILVIMFTFSRQGYLSCIVILMVYALRKGWKMTTIFLIGVALFWNFFIPYEVKKRIYYGSEEGVVMGLKQYTLGDTTAGRDEAWAAAAKPMKKYFLFGDGMNTYLKSIHPARPDLPIHPHSAYIQSMLDMGIFGSVLFIGFYVFLMWKSWFLHKRSKSSFARAYAFGFFLSIAIFMFQAYTGFRFYPNEESYYIWLFLGGLMWVERNQKELVAKGW